MKAIVAAQYGDLNHVTVKEIATPEANLGEVLVEVQFAGVNPLDIKLVNGAMQGYFPLETPFVVGTDFAGVVFEDAGALRKGQRVFGRLEPLPVEGKQFGRTGTFAPFVSVPVSCLTEIPESLTMESAAALPTSCGTAWQAIFEAGNVQAGQTVLIHGGGGGVGGFAVQFASQAGARVIATASRAQLDYVRNLGAEEVIDYMVNDFSLLVKGADLVLDTIGGEVQSKSFSVLRKGGTLLSTVQPPDESQATSHGVNSAFVFHITSSDRLQKLAEAVAKGTVHAEIAKVFPLQEAVAALEYVAAGPTKGKVLVSIS